jgi:hypothetical protein
MSSIKDKLTQSVRQARSAQPAATPAPAKRARATPPRKAAKTTAAEQNTGATAPAKSLAAEPTPSGSTLFPQRVWPD